MAKNIEMPDWVKCYVCEKKIYIAGKRKLKKTNGSGRIDISQARKLRNGRWVCSDICFNLAANTPNEPISLDPD